MSVGIYTVPVVQDVENETGVRRLVITAALRAAVAWSTRDTEPRAWRELSRMAGVVAYALGPGRGPGGPLELVESLRQPLSKFLGPASDDGVAGGVVLLDAQGELTDAAFEVAGEYTQALFDTADPGERWLPRWAWQRAEQVERGVFENLTSGTADEYVASRRFLIEHPAGDERQLTEWINAAKACRAAPYGPVPLDRTHFVHGTGWWWPCPVCRWPMLVRGAAVACGYSHHEARFRIQDARSGTRSPALMKMSSARMTVPPAQPLDGARCVDLAVWRFVTVPGVPELQLHRRLLRLSGVVAELWPDKDRVDLLVRLPGGGRWEVDVKDRTNPFSIVQNPPSARDIVVPNFRRNQVSVLARALPQKRIWTVSSFVRRISSAMSVAIGKDGR